MKRHTGIDLLARRRWPAGGLLLAVLGLGLASWQALQTTQDMDQLKQHQVGVRSLQRPAAPPRPAMSAEDIRRHAQMDRLSLQLARPWEGLLALFEGQSAKGIVLVKFEPNADDGRVELTGRADHAKALGDYLVTLESDRRLTAVQLHHHEVQRDASRGGATGSIEFSIGATWVGAAAQGAVSGPIAAPGVSAPGRRTP